MRKVFLGQKDALFVKAYKHMRIEFPTAGDIMNSPDFVRIKEDLDRCQEQDIREEGGLVAKSLTSVEKPKDEMHDENKNVEFDDTGDQVIPADPKEAALAKAATLRAALHQGHPLSGHASAEQISRDVDENEPHASWPWQFGKEMRARIVDCDSGRQGKCPWLQGSVLCDEAIAAIKAVVADCKTGESIIYCLLW